MRPAGGKKSFLRRPFDFLLGRESAVRILRVLVRASRPRSPPAIAKEASLTEKGTLNTLHSLLQTDVVTVEGTGRSKLYSLRENHPLAAALRHLFEEEQARSEAMFSDLKETFVSVRPAPVAVWVGGDIAAEKDKPDSQFLVFVLGEAGDLSAIEEQLENLVPPIEKKHLIDIELRFLTKADLLSEMTPEGQHSTVTGIYGPDPSSLLKWSSLQRSAPSEASKKIDSSSGGKPKGHDRLDEKSLRLGQNIAKKIALDPSLVDKAAAYARERLKTASPGEARTMREWLQILENQSLTKICDLLSSNSERAVRLRQSLPFAGLVESDDELDS